MPQASPQPPQLAESVSTFTQLRPQATLVPVHRLTQASAWQNGVVPEQASPHLPQLFGSLSSERHWPLQLEVSVGQVQAAFVHAWPPPQVAPHLPQLSGSVPVTTQAEPQLVWPDPEQTQLEPEQRWPAPQLAPQAPQWAGSVVRLTQASPQRIVPAAHVTTHCPAPQLSPPPQAWPHAPQLAGSFATLLHTPLQESCPLEQVPASGAEPPAPPECAPAQLPPSQTTEGVQSKSTPQMPVALRPQLAATSAMKASTSAPSKRPETETER